MEEYCNIKFSWEPDTDPHGVIEYILNSDETPRSPQTHHDILRGLGSHRLQMIRNYFEDASGNSQEYEHCTLTLTCTPAYNVVLAGFAIASEARTLEIYDKNGGYLRTIRGVRDLDDSEVDGSRVHFLCHCNLEKHTNCISLKFLSLGQRKSFEIAHIRLMLEACPVLAETPTLLSKQTINMDQLRQDIDDMGDTVSERAKAFLTTLENFQKSKQGTIEDVRQMLSNKNLSSSASLSLASMPALLAMFSSMAGANTDTAFASFTHATNNQDMSVGTKIPQQEAYLALQGKATIQDRNQESKMEDMFKLLQSICEQHSQINRQENNEREQKKVLALESSQMQAESLTPQMVSQLDNLVQTRMEAVEERLIAHVDAHLERMESRVSGKLDTLLALLQKSSTPSSSTSSLPKEGNDYE